MSEKRDALRKKLIDAAEKRMELNGLTGLRARDVTKDAGCALGGLYNAFGDLDDLILHVNARTLDRLSQSLQKAVSGATPKDALLAMAMDYAHFAKANRRLWDALFDFKPANDRPAPDWFREHQSAVMHQVIGPLQTLQPNMSPDDLRLRARTYFSAIHGIVSISLQGRFVGVPDDQLDQEITRFSQAILARDSDKTSSGPSQ